MCSECPAVVVADVRQDAIFFRAALHARLACQSKRRLDGFGTDGPEVDFLTTRRCQFQQPFGEPDAYLGSETELC